MESVDTTAHLSTPHSHHVRVSRKSRGRTLCSEAGVDGSVQTEDAATQARGSEASGATRSGGRMRRSKDGWEEGRGKWMGGDSAPVTGRGVEKSGLPRLRGRMPDTACVPATGRDSSGGLAQGRWLRGRTPY
eukprot:6214298-Pleurochrysis_carterae.AAC.4